MEIQRILDSTTAGAGRVPDGILDAARQFEALLVTALIRAARDEESWLGGGEDACAAPALEFAEEQLASAISAGGGLGLARMIAGAVGTALQDPLRGKP